MWPVLAIINSTEDQDQFFFMRLLSPKKRVAIPIPNSQNTDMFLFWSNKDTEKQLARNTALIPLSKRDSEGQCNQVVVHASDILHWLPKSRSRLAIPM
jgi:hypothetical protein